MSRNGKYKCRTKGSKHSLFKKYEECIPNRLETYYLHGTNLWTFMSALMNTDLFLVPGCNERSVPLVGESAGTTNLNWKYVSTVEVSPNCFMLQKALNNTLYYAKDAAEKLDKTLKKYNKNINISDINKVAQIKKEIINKLNEELNNLNSRKNIFIKNENGNERKKIFVGYSVGNIEYTRSILQRQIEFYNKITPERFQTILELSKIGIIVAGTRLEKNKKIEVKLSSIEKEVGLEKLKIKYIAPAKEGDLKKLEKKIKMFQEIIQKSFPENNIVSLSQLANILLKGNPIEPACQNYFENLPKD